MKGHIAKQSWRVALVLVAGLLFSSCAEKDYLVTITTEYGEMKMVLFDQAPEHKETFLKLAGDGAYDSTIFHRVMQGFMIQGGDINRKPDVEERVETLIDPEFVPGFIHVKGMVAAARAPDGINPQKRSGTQFYIVHGTKFTRSELENRNEEEYYAKLVNSLNQIFQTGKHRELLNEIIALQEAQDAEGIKEKVYGAIPIIENESGLVERKTYTDEEYEAYEELGGAPWLDGEYTIFGQVVEGVEIVDQIAEQQVGVGNQPVQDIYMTISVEVLPKSKIERTYDFKYPEVDTSN